MPDPDVQSREPVPMRGELPPEVEEAARLIHREVWKTAYSPLRGPMHFAGGHYWRDRLLSLAARWERLAKAARTCAEFLPAKDSENCDE